MHTFFKANRSSPILRLVGRHSQNVEVMASVETFHDFCLTYVEPVIEVQMTEHYILRFSSFLLLLLCEHQGHLPHPHPRPSTLNCEQSEPGGVAHPNATLRILQPQSVRHILFLHACK